MDFVDNKPKIYAEVQETYFTYSFLLLPSKDDDMDMKWNHLMFPNGYVHVYMSIWT